jgi:SnoaL-like domain
MDTQAALSVAHEALDDSHPVALFCRVFSRLTPDTPMPLAELYTVDVRFEDPLHQLEGLEQVRQYFTRLNAGLVEGRFSFGEALVGETLAMVPWTMHLSLKRLKRPVVVAGCSHLRYDLKVSYQRDYFDLGALIYEQLPVLGAVIRGIKASL